MTSASDKSFAKGLVAGTAGASDVTRTFAFVVGERWIVRGWLCSSSRFDAWANKGFGSARTWD